MQTFQIAPAEFRAMWFIVVIVLLVVVLAGGLLATAIRGSRSSTFVSTEGLRLRGDMYGRLIPASHVRSSEARRPRRLRADDRRIRGASQSDRSRWLRVGAVVLSMTR
jgi:hypothetical protein